MDVTPSLIGLPANLAVNSPFASYADLPLGDCDGWLYTSACHGLATILIELAVKGMPIVGSDVDGVCDPLTTQAGWPLPADVTDADYVAIIHDMLSALEERTRRTLALRRLAMHQHGRSGYADTLVVHGWRRAVVHLSIILTAHGEGVLGGRRSTACGTRPSRRGDRRGFAWR